MAVFNDSDPNDDPIQIHTADNDVYYYSVFDQGEQLTLDNWCRQ
jgi:hypothetical protein